MVKTMKRSELEKRLEQLEEKVAQLLGDKLYKDPHNRLASLVLDAVENKKHTLLECDTIYCKDLSLIMHALYPDEPGFHVDIMNEKKAARQMGALLARTKILKKLITRVYTSADHSLGVKRATYNTSLWVLRNFDKYKSIPPPRLWEDHNERWLRVRRLYDKRVADVEQLEETPSFL